METISKSEYRAAERRLFGSIGSGIDPRDPDYDDPSDGWTAPYSMLEQYMDFEIADKLIGLALWVGESDPNLTTADLLDWLEDADFADELPVVRQMAQFIKAELQEVADEHHAELYKKWAENKLESLI